MCVSKSGYVCVFHDFELLRYVQFGSSFELIYRIKQQLYFLAGMNKVYC